MAPFFNPDSAEVSEVILPDGATASEVLAPDGSTVFGNVIPDSENLQARYDARTLSKSDGDSVSTWVDESGNGNDMNIAAGTATYRSSDLDGLPTVEIGDGDRMDASISLSPPYAIFMLGRCDSIIDNGHMWGVTPPSSGLVGHMTGNSGVFEYKKNGGGNGSLQTQDTNNHIFSNQIASSEEDARLDGANEVETSVGAKSASTLSIGGRPDGVSGNPGSISLVEILVYSVEEQGNESEIESYLDRDTNLL